MIFADNAPRLHEAGVSKETRDAVRAGLTFKRWGLEGLRAILKRPNEPLEPAGVVAYDIQKTLLSEAVVVTMSRKLAPFVPDGSELTSTGQAALPFDAMILVVTDGGGTVEDVTLWGQDEQRIYLSMPVWFDKGDWEHATLPAAVFSFDRKDPRGGAWEALATEKLRADEPCWGSLIDWLDDRASGPLCALLGSIKAGAVRLIADGVTVDRARALAREQGAARVDYRICRIDPEIRPKHRPLGGTHAPPRWHLRRGHYRNLPSGKSVFVRQCEVGDAARGAVIKDYAVEARP